MIEGLSAVHVVLAVTAVGVAVLAFHWLITVTEGAYLGARTVRFLYDRDAPNYERIKGFVRTDEITFLANPLFNRLEQAAGADARVLDVATGTARLPVALFDMPFYSGSIVGVDFSRPMLEVAVAKTAVWSSRCEFLHAVAEPLPFADASFDAVSMLEALEFLPNRGAALAEMVRVLRPGGVLLVTNRIGTDARLMPGHTDNPQGFEQRLARLGLIEIETRPWMVYYALVFAHKPGSSSQDDARAPWYASLRCAQCGRAGTMLPDVELELMCASCGHQMRERDRIWTMR